MTAVNGAVEPTEYNSLDDILAEGVSSERPISVQVCHNMGARTFLFSMPMKEFYDQSIVANEIGPNEEPVAQRKLDPKHAAELSKYLLKGLIRQPFLNVVLVINLNLGNFQNLKSTWESALMFRYSLSFVIFGESPLVAVHCAQNA